MKWSKTILFVLFYRGFLLKYMATLGDQMDPRIDRNTMSRSPSSLSSSVSESWSRGTDQPACCQAVRIRPETPSTFRPPKLSSQISHLPNPNCPNPNKLPGALKPFQKHLLSTSKSSVIPPTKKGLKESFKQNDLAPLHSQPIQTIQTFPSMPHLRRLGHLGLHLSRQLPPERLMQWPLGRPRTRAGRRVGSRCDLAAMAWWVWPPVDLLVGKLLDAFSRFFVYPG